MEAKPRTTSVKKTDKGNPAAGGDKKEGSIKEQSNPTPKKTATGDTAPANHETSKPPVPEPQGPAAATTTENKISGEEQGASNGAAEGSEYEGLKPILVAAGVAVAAIAVIIGVVYLARKK